MPLFDLGCTRCNYWFEAFLHTRDKPNPNCPKCKSQTRRLISRFAAIWTRSLSDYGDPHKESYHADQKRGGHWAFRKRSEGGTPDAPIPVFLETRQQQKDFVRAEGLVDPNEIGNISVKSDGEGVTSCGQPGAWV